MKWQRYGNVWRADLDASHFEIARQAGHYYLTERLGLFADPVGLGEYLTLAAAKTAAMNVHPEARS